MTHLCRKSSVPETVGPCSPAWQTLRNADRTLFPRGLHGGVVYAGEGQTQEGGLRGHITFTAVRKQKLHFGGTTRAASGCVLTLHVNGS